MIKDYKLLLAGALLLTLIVFVLIFAWLWSHNRKNINPVPIVADTRTNETEGADGESIHTATVNIKADTRLQQVLDDLIVRFESRYPNTQIAVDYVDNAALFNIAANKDVSSKYLVDTDVIMSDTKLAKAQIKSLQDILNSAQEKRNAAAEQTPAPEETPESVAADMLSPDTDTNSDTDTNNDAVATAEPKTHDNSESRQLNAFSYAIHPSSEQAVEGMILTNNPAAISFRNYILSSEGQDVLSRHDYGNIDGYQKSIDELFNPTTVENKESTVDVADALKDGK